MYFVPALHGEAFRASRNPGPTVPGAAFVALHLSTGQMVAPHPAELRALINTLPALHGEPFRAWRNHPLAKQL